MPSFFRELKQRRVVQIVVSYAVSAWVAMEVVGALVERGIIPDLTYRIGLVLFLGGLLVALVTGWYHGEKGEQKATRVEIVLLVLIAAGTVYGGVRTVQSYRAAKLATTAGTSGKLDLTRIGVLYFRDQSPNGDLGYLADGLTESLIDRLTQVSGLHVISKAGASRFRGSDLPVDSIASLLSAGTIVTGSVEPVGDNVRVRLALMDGEAGSEIRHQSFEKPAGDPLELQDQLADEVAQLLRGWLGQAVALRQAQSATKSVPAYTDFERGERARKDAEERLQARDLQGFIADSKRADSLFAAAAGLDAKWTRPTVMRAVVALRWAQLSLDDPKEASGYLDQAVKYTDEVLAKAPRDAPALQVRGQAEYQRWAAGLSADPTQAAKVFDAAKQDLEAATDKDPSLANAWTTLSQVRSQVPDIVGANLAARRALEADEFLQSAESVLTTLYATSYDLENFRDAIQYCDEGHRRFPKNPTFTQCRLWLLATRAEEPDIDAAWKIMDAHLAMVPPSDSTATRIQDQLLVAWVIARAQKTDSALAVVARSKASPEVDPTRELTGFSALVYLQLDMPDSALDRLRIYLTASPEHRQGWRWTSHWWWRSLQDNPEYRRLIGR